MSHNHLWMPFPFEPEWEYCVCGAMQKKLIINSTNTGDDDSLSREKIG